MSKLKREYYESGELKSTCFEINGKRYGDYKQYYKNGQLEWICAYVNGNNHGEDKKYFETGELWSTCLYANDKLINERIQFYKNGIIHHIRKDRIDNISELNIYDMNGVFKETLYINNTQS